MSKQQNSTHQNNFQQLTVTWYVNINSLWVIYEDVTVYTDDNSVFQTQLILIIFAPFQSEKILHIFVAECST